MAHRRAPASSLLARAFAVLLAAATVAALFVIATTPAFEGKGEHFAAAAAPAARRPRRPGGYELFTAARAGDAAAVRDALRRGARAGFTTPTGQTALHAAAAGGHAAALRELLAADSGVFVSAMDTHGNTPLLLAAAGGHADAVGALLAAGASVAARTTYDKATPFLRASRANFMDVTAALLAAGSDPDVADVDGRTALTYAAEEQRGDMVRALVAAKAGIDIFQLSNGMTPLMCVRRARRRAPA
jgi:ankyrin repeat protein